MCRDVGIRLSAVDGKLKFAAPPGTVDARLKELLLTHKAELLGLLSRETPTDSLPTWDQTEALRLMDVTDAEVERSGISGNTQRIRGAAERAAESFARRDMPELHRACCEVIRAVHHARQTLAAPDSEIGQ
jgi:hypothetical protein